MERKLNFGTEWKIDRFEFSRSRSRVQLNGGEVHLSDSDASGCNLIRTMLSKIDGGAS